MFRNLFLIVALVVSTLGVQAGTQPAWWSAPGTNVLQAGVAADNYSVANVGQLKFFAWQANAYLDAVLPGRSGAEIDTLVAGFEPKANPPVPYSATQLAEIKRINYGPVTFRHLRNVAKIFYDRLKAAGYNTKDSLKNFGYPAEWTSDYPYGAASPNSADYSPVTIGQLKMVFSFNVNGVSAGDTDGDGLSDAWEVAQFGSTGPGSNDDTDNDGLTNAAEQAAGSSASNPDSDFDGVGDKQELNNDGTNPLDASSVTPKRVAYFPMDATNFVSAEGQLPRTVTGVTSVSGWKGNAARINANGNLLTYDWKRPDGSPNYPFQRGSIRLWFKPNWSSAAMTGTFSRIFEIGGPWGSGKAYSMLNFNATTPYIFLSEANGSGGTSSFKTDTPSLLWPGIWHQITATWAPGSCAIYLDGSVVGRIALNRSQPPKVSDIISAGLTIGNESSGGQPIYGTIDEVEVFNYVLTAAQVSASFTAETSADINGNTVTDYYEQLYKDTDDDGLTDVYEITYGLDPNVPNDLTVDSDGDGLTLGEEFGIGTNPNKVDTDGDTYSDSDELDSGSDPKDENSKPFNGDTNGGGEGGNYSPPPPPQYTPYIEGLKLKIDQSSISLPKYGFDTFKSTDPVKRYLRRIDNSYLVGGQPESPVQGYLVRTIDAETGEVSTPVQTGSLYSANTSNAQSPTYAFSSVQVSAYDDPPNEETDTTGTMKSTATLSRENTTNNVKALAKDKLPSYTGDFVEGAATGYRDLWADELGYTYTRTKYKWEWDANTSEQSKHPVRWIVIFQPEDDPETESEDESIKNIEILGGIQEWDGQGSASPVKEIDPDALKPGTKDGSFYVVTIEPESVSFDGDKYWELAPDDPSATPTPPTSYSAPQWYNQNGDQDADDPLEYEYNYNVAFTRNTKPKIGAYLKMQGLPYGLKAKMRLKGSGGIDAPDTEVENSSWGLYIEPQQSTTNFANTVKFYDKSDPNKAFSLDWEISLNDGQNWLKAATTKHGVCLTLKDPLTSTSLRQESLAVIGCRNADGQSSDQQTVDKIFDDFTDLSVAKVGSNTAMIYWGTWAKSEEAKTETPSCFDAAGLLQHGDGRCGAWAELLNNLIMFQGITGSQEQTITTKSTYPVLIGSGFLVKNWAIWQNPIQDLYGVAGQGNENPQAAFDNHAVVTFSSKIYDPSYGKIFASLMDWEDASLDGLLYNQSTQVLINSLGDEQTIMAP